MSLTFSLLMKIDYRERKEILTVQHQDNLVILEMLHLGSPIRFLYKDEELMRECHFLNHRQKVGKVFGGAAPCACLQKHR